MIWIDHGAGYHTSKTTSEYHRHVRPIRMDRPAQFSNLNSIENLWRIIKVQVNAKRHRS